MNNVTMIGYMGIDKKLTRTQTDDVVLTFTLGVQSKRKDKTTGKYITEWFHCEAWNGIGERLEIALDKGDGVAITGYLKTKKYSWQKVKYERDVIIVEDATFLDRKKAYKKLYGAKVDADMNAKTDNDGYELDNSNGNSDIENIDW